MPHFFRGYLQIRVITNSPEKFLNACSNKSIYLWGIVPETTGLRFNIHVRNFKKLKNIIRMTKSKTVILNKRGFPFIINRYKKRNLFAAGSVICLIMIFVLSCFTWSIEITGNETYTDEMILKYLNSQNIRTGTPLWKINCADIAANIRRKYDDIIWVSASIEGSYLKLNIKENENSRVLSEKNANMPMDIIAETDCLVKEVIIRNGIPMVKPGDYVKKGTVLVSGQIPVYNDAKEIISYQQCTADADIKGEIILEYNDSISYTNKHKNIFKDISKKQYFVRLKNKIFTFGNIKNNYRDYYFYSMQKSIYDLSYGIRTVKPYQIEIKKYDTNQIQQILTERFKNYCKELEKKGVVILQNDVKIYTWREKASASGQIITNQLIGIIRHSKPIIIQSGEQIDGNDGSDH